MGGLRSHKDHHFLQEALLVTAAAVGFALLSAATGGVVGVVGAGAWMGITGGAGFSTARQVVELAAGERTEFSREEVLSSAKAGMYLGAAIAIPVLGEASALAALGTGYSSAMRELANDRWGAGTFDLLATGVGASGAYWSWARKQDLLDLATVPARAVRISGSRGGVSDAVVAVRAPEGGAGAAPVVVYRGGARTPANLTPRPGVDVEGLSTYTTLELAVRPGGKAQVIEVSRLKQGGLSAVPDASPAGHVSIRPGVELTPEVQQAIRAWAGTRPGALADPAAPMHPYTRAIWEAIISEAKRPPQ
jgi:hypothetical protein